MIQKGFEMRELTSEEIEQVSGGVLSPAYGPLVLTALTPGKLVESILGATLADIEASASATTS